MTDVILVIVTALISGLVATILTIWWQYKSSIRTHKMQVFETLMSYRYMIHSLESVKALNSIDVIFYKDKEVRSAFKDFLNEADKKPEFNPNIADKHLKLLETMSRALKLGDIHWDEIKRVYYPTGLADKIHEEDALRKMQLQSVFEDIQGKEAQANIPSAKQFNQQIIAQILPELIKNPDSIRTLVELSRIGGGK